MITVHLLRHGEVHNPDARPLRAAARLPALRARRARRPRRRRTGWPGATSATWSPRRSQRAQQTAAPLAALTGLEIATDERLIEADNQLEGRPVAGGKGLFADPSNWKFFVNPLRPSWGEPYVEIAARVLAAARDARDARRRRARRSASATSCRSSSPAAAPRGERLFHDPRKRQCGLASVTSFAFDGDTIVRVDYAEPAADLPAGRGAGA